MAYPAPFNYYGGGQSMLAMTSQPQPGYMYKYGPHSVGGYEDYDGDR